MNHNQGIIILVTYQNKMKLVVYEFNLISKNVVFSPSC